MQNLVQVSNKRRSRLLHYINLSTLSRIIVSAVCALGFVGTDTASASPYTGVPFQIYLSSPKGVGLQSNSSAIDSTTTIETMTDGTEFDVYCYVIGGTVNKNPHWDYGTDASTGRVGYVPDYNVDVHWHSIQDLNEQGIYQCYHNGDDGPPLIPPSAPSPTANEQQTAPTTSSPPASTQTPPVSTVQPQNTNNGEQSPIQSHQLSPTAYTTDIGWSGYGVRKDKQAVTEFNSIEATWKVPKISCVQNGKPLSQNSYANDWEWIGFGGTRVGDENHLEQVGIVEKCDQTGAAHYAAFYETYGTPINGGESILVQRDIKGLPIAPPNNYCDNDFGATCYQDAMPVSPGDTITAQIIRLGNGKYSFSIKDNTWKGGFVTILNAPGKATTAEWIVEDAPFLPLKGEPSQAVLAPFGAITFTNCNVDGMPISDYPILTQFQTLTQVDKNYHDLGLPQLTNVGAIQSDDPSFTIQWLNYGYRG